jgi:phosphate transport system substrate-binding protein
MRASTLCLLLSLAFVIGCAGRGSTQSQPAGVTTIENIGSDTIVNLALAWAEAYQAEHPGVRISVTGGGSGTGIAALINGTADIANASRAMKPEEVEQARAAGFEPHPIVIARDAIAVIVHPSNLVESLTLQQLSDIYSGKIANWQDVGGEDRPIVLLSRETNSGTHVYFLETVLRLGDSQNKTLFRGGRRRARCATKHRLGQRRHVPDRAIAVHVHARRTNRSHRGLHQLDSQSSR